jgi:hypothetical protein
MFFKKHYLIGHAAAVWDQYCTLSLEGNYTWVATDDLFNSLEALTKHHTDRAFQKLHSAGQHPNQIVTMFTSHIVTTCENTDNTN